MTTPTTVTTDAMRERIARIDYSRPIGTLTLCVITLDNGFAVTGESACVDPANFDELLGQEIAYDNAFEKLWPLMGFLLAEDRYREGRA